MWQVSPSLIFGAGILPEARICVDYKYFLLDTWINGGVMGVIERCKRRTARIRAEVLAVPKLSIYVNYAIDRRMRRMPLRAQRPIRVVTPVHAAAGSGMGMAISLRVKLSPTWL